MVSAAEEGVAAAEVQRDTVQADLRHSNPQQPPAQQCLGCFHRQPLNR